MKIGYSKTYPVTAYWEKCWLEDEIEIHIPLYATDEQIADIMKRVRRIQYALKAQVESFHYESTAAAQKQMSTEDAIKYIEENNSFNVNTSPEQRIINQINEIQELKVLESFALIAKSKPEIQAAYDNKYNEILNRHSSNSARKVDAVVNQIYPPKT